MASMERRTFLRCLGLGMAAAFVTPTTTLLAPPLAEVAPGAMTVVIRARTGIELQMLYERAYREVMVRTFAAHVTSAYDAFGE